MIGNVNFHRYEKIVKKFFDRKFSRTYSSGELKFDEVVTRLNLADGFALETNHYDGNDDGCISIYYHRARNIWIMVDRWRPRSTMVVIGASKAKHMAWAMAKVSGLDEVWTIDDLGPGFVGGSGSSPSDDEPF